MKIRVLLTFSLIIFLFFSCSETSDAWKGRVVMEDGIRKVYHDDPAVSPKHQGVLQELYELSAVESSIDSNRIFARPISGVFDSNGNIYVADMKGNFVRKFSKENRFLKSFGSKGHAPGEFLKIVDVALDKEDKLYVLDGDLRKVVKFDTAGTVINTFACKELMPSSFIVDSHNNILITSFFPTEENYYVYKYSSAGRLLDKLCPGELSINDLGEGVAGDMWRLIAENITAVSIDAADNIYLAFARPARIRKYSPEGELQMVIDDAFELIAAPGMEAGKGFIGDIAYTDIAVDEMGHIYAVAGGMDRKGKAEDLPQIESRLQVFNAVGELLASKKLRIDKFLGYRISVRSGAVCFISPYHAQIDIYRMMFPEEGS